MSMRQRINRLIELWDARWSVATQIWAGIALMASASIPAWATWASGIFAQYSPLSWVLAGFVGLLLWSLVRALLAWAYSIRVRAAYDARFVGQVGNYNPLDKIFENQRIYLDHFALPSNPYIEGKTFVDCDIIGPANVYWFRGNQAHPIRQPVIDAICLDPDAKFTNGFIFVDCIFRNCSFQRITVFAGTEYFPDWKTNRSVNIISVVPSPEQIERRTKLLATPSPSEPATLEKPAQLEAPTEDKEAEPTT